MIFDIFTTREFAAGIWIIFVVILLFIFKATRRSAFGLVKIATSKIIIISFILLVLYSALLSYLFSMTALWKWIFAKDITVWIVFVGVPVFFGAVTSEIDKGYFWENTY